MSDTMPEGSTQTPHLVKITVKNRCAYPVRVPIFVSETDGKITYTAFKTFEARELEVNQLTIRHLQGDPKVRLSRAQ